MDLEHYLNSMDDDGNIVNSAMGNSEPKAKEAEPTPSEPTPGEVDEHQEERNDVVNGGDGESQKDAGSHDGDSNEDGVASSNDDGSATEAEPSDGKNANDQKKRRPLTQLEKAEYSAAKWKRKAKAMRAEMNGMQSELEKFRGINPESFDNYEDMMKFLAWKASTEQQVSDMGADLRAMQNNYDSEIYEAKIADCFNDRGAAEYEALDEKYGQVFAMACHDYDPDNVIVDFLKGSRYEPAMRNVIYKNGMLQDQLFKVYSNRSIGNAERLSILKDLESQVKDFYRRNASGAKPRVNNVGAQIARQQESVQQQNKSAQNTTPKNVGGTQPNSAKPRRFELPPQQNKAPVNNAPKNVNRMVTGSLTRGSEPGGKVDVSAAAKSLYKDLMGF